MIPKLLIFMTVAIVAILGILAGAGHIIGPDHGDDDDGFKATDASQIAASFSANYDGFFGEDFYLTDNSTKYEAGDYYPNGTTGAYGSDINYVTFYLMNDQNSAKDKFDTNKALFEDQMDKMVMGSKIVGTYQKAKLDGAVGYFNNFNTDAPSTYLYYTGYYGNVFFEGYFFLKGTQTTDYEVYVLASEIYKAINNPVSVDKAKKYVEPTPVYPTIPDEIYYKNGVSVNNKIPSTTSDNVVTLYEKPKIFTVYAQNIELLCALGCEDLIVGAYVGDRGVAPLNEKYADQYYKVVNNTSITKEVSSNAWSKEEVMSTGANLIIGWSSTFSDTSLGTREFWQPYGVQIFKTNLYGNGQGASMETYYQLLDSLGTLLNAKEKAQQNIDMWKTKISDILTKTSSLPQSEKPKVLCIDYSANWYNGGWTFCYGTGMLTGCIIEAAGADDIDSGRMDKHTLEEISKMDFDFVLTVDQPKDQTVAEWWNSTPVLKAMNIDDSRIQGLPFNTLYMSGILQEDVLDILFAMFYPDLV